MLDRVFLSRLSPKGKKAYFLGQLGVAALLAAIIFSAVGFEDGEGIFIVSVLITIVTWGLICLKIWPKSVEPVQEETGDSKTE
jgi:uncharacterized membrane protein YccC